MSEGQKKYAILIVDDTTENIDVLAGMLSEEFQTRATVNGEKALQIAAATPQPDLILLDIMMPGLDGYEVCRRLQADEQTRDIPVIFVTALSEVEDEAKGLEIGAVDYITKPISPAIVLARVRTHLALKMARENLKKQNEILRDNIRLREDVERMTHHDLKTPLNAILNIPRVLLEDKNLDKEQVDLLGMVEEAGYRMLDIINSSLDLYKMETGKYRLAPVPVDLIETVNQIHGETKEMMVSKKLALRVLVQGKPKADGDRFVVRGEKMLCYSIFANLLKNAVEASPENETITMAFDDPKRPRIAIHNKGVIPEEIRENFFDKYVTAGKKGGTGLGTYTAKLSTRVLGGDISFESSDAKGTILKISLPPAAPSEARVKSEPVAGQTSVAQRDISSLSILIVDDSPAMRRTISGILKQMGCTRFFGANDGGEALKILDDEEIDFIISDKNMPNVDGFELLRNIRSIPQWANIPFVMVTGDAEMDTVLLAAKTRVSEFIIKPFSADLLKKKIESALAMK